MLSQAELAKRSGVSLGCLKRFERTGQISLESLLWLVNVLNRLDDYELVLNTENDLKKIEKLVAIKPVKQSKCQFVSN